MTTFQAVVYATIHGISEFLPISSKAHHILIPYLVGWQQPAEPFVGALSLGSFLALLIYFRHDWASMISCFLQVLIYRKRPMTLDERLPLFLTVTTLPVVLASTYFGERVAQTEWTTLSVCAIFAVVGIPLWFFDSFNRKLKGMFDWKWLDAGAVGIVMATALIPGWDPLSGVLIGAFLLNYKREPALKYAYFSITPIILFKALTHLKGIHFHNAVPIPDVSWLSFCVAILVTTLVGLLSIGGFMKHVQQKGLGQYVIYRWILAAGIAGLYWVRTRG